MCVCMYVCMYVLYVCMYYMYVCMYVCMYVVPVGMYVCMYRMYVCMYVCIHYVCMYACMYVPYVCMYVCTVCMYVCMYLCMYVCQCPVCMLHFKPWSLRLSPSLLLCFLHSSLQGYHVHLLGELRRGLPGLLLSCCNCLLHTRVVCSDLR